MTLKNNNLSVNLIALSKLKGMGRKRISDFISEIFNNTGQYNFNYEDIRNSKITQLIKLVENDLTSSSWDFECNKAQKIIEDSTEKGIYTINFCDEEYPKELFVLDKRPLILFVKGNLDLLTDEKKVAIVGTRNPSLLAEKMTPKITEQFSKMDYTVVSGLAIGCDTLAHEIASVTNGKTIAILAHGLDVPIYPKENRSLGEDILRNGGALVSEYPIGVTLRPSYLVERDEWQSGMSLGTIAIESSENGGSRHASYKALEQERLLGALDHTQYRNSKGHQLFLSTDHSISLNQQIISKKLALPLYSLESLHEFDKRMKLIKSSVEQQYLLKKQKRTTVLNTKDDNIISEAIPLDLEF